MLRQEVKANRKAARLHTKENFLRNNEGAENNQKENSNLKTFIRSLFGERSPFYPQDYSFGIFTNSLFIFLLAYLISYLIYQFTVIIFASYYNIDGVLFYYDLKFNDVSSLWDRFNIILITGSGPVVCMIIGIFLYRKFFSLRRFHGYQLLFILWLSLHLINHFLGAFTAGIVTSDGYGYVANWLYLGIPMKLFVSLLFLLIFMVIGYRSAIKFLIAMEYRIEVGRENIKSLLVYVVLLPMLAGTLLLILIRIPHNFTHPYETLVFFTMLMGVIPAVFNSGETYFKPEDPKPLFIRPLRYEYLFMLILMLLFYRIVLAEGLRIVMRYSFSFSAGLA